MNTLDYTLPFTNKIEDDVVFQNPWHSQLFAITVQLSETKNFSWKEFVEFFGKSLNESRLEVNHVIDYMLKVVNIIIMNMYQNVHMNIN
jgi:hypothetical protein